MKPIYIAWTWPQVVGYTLMTCAVLIIGGVSIFLLIDSIH